MLPPVDAVGPLLALPFIVGLVGAAVTYAVARRWSSPYAVVLAPLALLALAIVLGTLEPASVLVQGVAVRPARHRLDGAARGAQPGAPAERRRPRRPGRARRPGCWRSAAAAGYAAGPHLPGADADARRGGPIRRDAALRRRAVPQPARRVPPLHRAQRRRPLGPATCSGPGPARRARRCGSPPSTPTTAPSGAPPTAPTTAPGAGDGLPAGRLAGGAPAGHGPPVEVAGHRAGGWLRDVWLPTAGTVDRGELRRRPRRPARLAAVAQHRHQHGDRARPARAR